MCVCMLYMRSYVYTVCTYACVGNARTCTYIPYCNALKYQI